MLLLITSYLQNVTDIVIYLSLPLIPNQLDLLESVLIF